MGGRGSSSGMSVDNKPYGSQYHTLLESGNIKFVTKISRTSETLMETMTKGRVYVTVGGNELLSVIYFDTANKRAKAIDLSHPHDGRSPHVHHGYLHNETGSPKGASNLTPAEKRMVARVQKLWYNHLGK